MDKPNRGRPSTQANEGSSKLAGEIRPGSERPIGSELPTIGIEASVTQASNATATTFTRSTLTPGTVIGRYVVLDKIAAGGMGVVYKAFDPELDRKVAVKVVSVVPESGEVATRAAARLMREAKALAQLSHPNVVAVYDVGSFGDDVFIAMAFVEGTTLRAWNQQARRTPEQVARIFVEAGRGLAAAHKAGIIHRDFKPDNVLVANDGRVQVVDFGIAVAKDAEHSDVISGELVDADTTHESLQTPPSHSARLTKMGALVGTPSYMSPEQFHAGDVNAKSDQFSFCIALYESLYGKRPFRGKKVVELKRNVTAGRMRDPGKDSHVPAHLRRIVERGLSVDPSLRYPSMDDLLADLRRNPRAARRRAGLVAASIGLAVFATIAVMRVAVGPTQICQNARAELIGRWDNPARERVQQSFVASKRAFAGDAFQRVAAVMDNYAAQWVDARTATCKATHVHGTQSSQMLDLRMRCLAHKADALAALATVLSSKLDHKSIDKSLSAAHSLPRIDSCDDDNALLAAVPPPTDADTLATVASARDKLARARALQSTGRHGDGIAIITGIKAVVESTKYPPLLAEHNLLESQLQLGSGNANESEQASRRAIEFGSEARNDALVADAWIVMLRAIEHQGDLKTRLRLHPLAAATVTRAGNNPLQRSLLERELGSLYHELGRYDEGIVHFQNALALSQPVLGTNHPDVAVILNDLGNIYLRKGDLAEASSYYQDSLVIRERIFGARHPKVAGVLCNLASLAEMKSNYAQGEKLFSRALGIFQGLYGDEHPHTVLVYQALGELNAKLGRFGKAETLIRRALSIREQRAGSRHHATGESLTVLGKILVATEHYQEAEVALRRAAEILQSALGADHWKVAVTRIALAVDLTEQGRHGDALPLYQQALKSLRHAHGEDHHEVAAAFYQLGRGLARSRQCSRAVPHLQRAIATLSKSLGKAHAALVAPLTELGTCYLTQGQPNQAISPLQRALAIRKQNPLADPYEEAQAAFSLARALWQVPGQRSRVLTLLDRAKEIYAKDERPSAQRRREQVNKWIMKRQQSRGTR